MGDEVGMGVVIYTLEKYLSNGSNGRNYLQFNMVRQLRVAASEIYAATDAANSSTYFLKSHHGIVLHMYEGVMQSFIMERFPKGNKKIMPEYLDQNKPLKYLVINYILNDIKHKWVGSDTDQESKIELTMTASYIGMK